MEAISTTINQMNSSAANEELQRKIQKEREQLATYKCQSPMSYEQFKELLTANAQQILLKRSVNTPYVIDQYNGPVIKQLYYYFTGNPLCKWNLDAGLVFAGKIGCGKSVLMMAFLQLSNEYSRRLTTIIHSKRLAELIKAKGIEFYEKRPVFIDELGREETEFKDYGNVMKPVIDLLALRYEAGSRTYASTNYNLDALEGFYGKFIRSRMEEMMTLVHVPGESRRLKNEVK